MDDLIAFVRTCLNTAGDTRQTRTLRRLVDRITASPQLVHEDETHGRLLRHVAARFTDQPGYRKEWRP